MKRIIHEIHRRSLWQVLGIYLAGSWVALQVVETLSESMSLPEWVQGFSVILLVLGLPIVLATAFVQEGVGRRPEGEPSVAHGDDDAGDSVDSEERAEATVPGTAVGGVPPSARSSGRRRARGLFTWRRAIVGGVVAFAILGVSLVGWVVLRSLGVGPAGTLVAKGILEDQATLLLTDFASDDPSLSRAATEAIRVDLTQSSVVKVAEPGFVIAALERMQRSPEDGLDIVTGRDLAQREGMPAVITGEISSVGGGYVLTAQILTAESGEVLVSDRVTAADDADLIGAIDRLSKRLRERIGESLGDLAGTPALARVTTADLEALRLYSRAVQLSDEGDQRQAVDLLEQAVSIDSTFAMAWRKIGAIHTSGGGALGQYTRGVEAYAKAYEFRDRLTERERLLTTAGYYLDVEYDPRRAADTYEEMLRRDPEDSWALNNLGIIMGSDLGDDRRAIELLERTIEVDSGASNGYWNLSVAQGRGGDFDGAAGTIEAWERNFPEDATAFLFHASLAASRRDFRRADSLARVAVTLRPGNPLDRAFSLGVLGVTSLTQGRLSEGLRLIDEAETVDSQLGAGRALGTALRRAEVELDTRGNSRAATRDYQAALSRYPIEDMAAMDPPWPQLVTLAARLQGADPAREALARWDAADPASAGRPARQVALAWVDIAAGDPAAALARLEDVRDPECLHCAPYARFAAARELDDPRLIAEHGEAYVNRNGTFRIFGDAATLGPAMEEVARRYDELGNREKAATYYAAFVELWAEADDELQPRVQAAQARLEAILQEIG